MGVGCDEVGDLVEIGDWEVVVLDEFCGCFVGVLREVVGEFEGRFAVFDVDVEDVVVVSAQVVFFLATAADGVDDGAHVQPELAALRPLVGGHAAVGFSDHHYLAFFCTGFL